MKRVKLKTVSLILVSLIGIGVIIFGAAKTISDMKIHHDIADKVQLLRRQGEPTDIESLQTWVDTSNKGKAREDLLTALDAIDESDTKELFASFVKNPESDLELANNTSAKKFLSRLEMTWNSWPTKNKDSLDQLQLLARGGNLSNLPIQFSPPDDSIPYNRKMFVANQLLRLDALVCIESGNTAKVLELIPAIHALADTLFLQSNLTSFLLACMCLNQADSVVQCALLKPRFMCW